MIIRMTYGAIEYWTQSRIRERFKKSKTVVSRFWDGLDKKPSLAAVALLLGAKGKITPTFTMQHSHHFECGIMIEDNLFAVLNFMSASKFELMLGGSSHAVLMKLVAKVDKYMQDLRGHEEERVGLTFSFLTGSGPRFYYRRVVCPTWEEIKDNYTNAEAIEWLLNLEDPLAYGKLLFWHGIPGTGKTFGIRALLREWKHKADFFYILDPENLFGKSAGYLIETLLQVPENEPKEAGDNEDEKSDKHDRLKVLVIEDALDFLLQENRKEMSPAMSRLLNLTEGLVGQGFKVLVLITTNEKVGQIDPAFTRVGRCLQVLEFQQFPRKQAIEWLKNHGIENPIEEEATLAELYAELRPVSDFSPIVEQKKVSGFKTPGA